MSEEESPSKDPFASARSEGKTLRCPFQGENIPMILRHGDVRAAAKDWTTYSSDAPFRVPIPSEEDMRSVRQYPIETDPPEHTEYRKLVEPFFKRARLPEVVESVTGLIAEALREAIAAGGIEVVRDFALPIQSRALTYLLNVPIDEAEEWTEWGIHVFNDGDSGSEKGGVLHEYLCRRFDQAEGGSGEDFFSALTKATYQGRPLTRDEMLGFGNLTFAGGRDTIIHTISCVFAHFGENLEALEFLREDPKRIALASEEFFRIATPLTHIGRVCPVDTDVHGEEVPAGGRVSLGWASANRDETVFDQPDEVRLDRKPNPHVAFGAGAHLCLGAPHARLVVRALLEQLTEQVGELEITGAERLVEREARYDRAVGYESLDVRFSP